MHTGLSWTERSTGPCTTPRAHASSSGGGELCSGWPSSAAPVKLAPEEGAAGRKVETSLGTVRALEVFLSSDLNES